MRGNYYQPFSLRISEEMHHKLRIIAENHKRSENKEIEFALAYEEESRVLVDLIAELESIVNTIKPEVVIVIDALCSNEKQRLFKTIQFTNKGISPGSGVKNERKELSEKTLGIPVIAIGIPTVIDIGSCNSENDTQMIVTPKDIDMIISRASSFLSLAINCAIQPNMEPETFLALS